MSSSTTKAIIQTEYGAASVLSIGEAQLPPIGDLDVLVRNIATGVNPVDFKVRGGMLSAPIDPANPLVIGWDAAGVVEGVGSAVTGFAVGDEVYYAGDLFKPGTYAEKTVVDSRIVAHKPKNLTFAEACTIPLVALTAHESLVEELRVEAGNTLVIYNGAGGVGSFVIQYAKHLGLTVVATASRPETVEWVKSLGADEVINHREELLPQFESKGIKPNYVLELHSNARIGELMKSLAPFGRACLVNPASPENLATIDGMDMLMGRKSMGYELMFSRPFAGVEVEKQGKILATVAELLDEGKLRHTVKRTLPWTNVGEAHELQEKGTSIGKTALAVTEEASLKTVA
ncbi:unnamed protein product [Discosporangium mesarthrocarpum]